MKKYSNPLDNIKIASPCPADWNEMRGDARRRHCLQCGLNVYNLSDMTRDEAESFLINSEGRVCVKYYRRKDGTVLTQDCPVGWALVKKRVSRAATAVFASFFGLFTGLFAFQQFEMNPLDLSNEVVVEDNESMIGFIPILEKLPVSVNDEPESLDEITDAVMGKPDINSENYNRKNKYLTVIGRVQNVGK